ncbi:hypothetical protein MSZK_12850 [Mycobacterium sp. shizuoka-1]|nr:hypothetical protein MSZK_12850 [Mycobacterium sp. shizuoka-1]
MSLMGPLSEVVSGCPHAVLIASQCLLGEFACATRGTERGATVVLQPCTPDRTPTAPAVWIGPIRSDADAETVCRWISHGRWNTHELPDRLRLTLNLARAAAAN